MHKTKIAKKVFAVMMAQIMAVSMALTGPFSVTGYAATEDSVDKDEIVYVITDADGDVDKVIVNDTLKKKNDSSNYVDMSDLDDITNVKGDEEMTENADGTISWQNDGNEISYQGNSTKALPVDVKISYWLDGQKISAEDLEGKSGKVKIRFDYVNNEMRQVSVDGKEYKVYVPFVLVSGMVVDSEHFSNIHVENGKALSEGDKTIIFGYAMPGVKESLGLGSEVLSDMDEIELPEYVEITADVTEYTKGLTMTAVTNDLLSNMEDDSVDSSEAEDSINDLQDASNQLVDGTGDLAKGTSDAYDGSKKIAENMGKLSTGVSAIDVAIGKYTNGVDQLYSKVPTLTNGVNALNTGSSQLSTGAAALKTGTDAYVTGVETLAAGLLGDGSAANPGYLKGVEQLAAGATALSGLSALGNVYQAVCLMANATGTEATYITPDGSESPTLGYGAAAVDAGLKQIIEALKAMQQGMDGQALTQLVTTLNQADGLVQMASAKVTAANQATTGAAEVIGAASKEAADQAGNVENAKEQLKKEKEEINDEISAKNSKISEKNQEIASAEKKANEEINGSVDKTVDALGDAISTLEASKEALKAAETEEKKFTEEIKKIDAEIAKVKSEKEALSGKKNPVDVKEESVSSFSKISVDVKTDDISGDQLAAYKTRLDENPISGIEFTKESNLGAMSQGIHGAVKKIGSNPFAELIASLQQVEQGAAGVSAGVGQLHSNIETMKAQTSSFPQAGEGIVALNKGFEQLTSNNGTIRTGAETLLKNGKTLKDGAAEVASGSKELANGTSTLASGASTLSKGVGTLASNNKALNDGTKQLVEGSKLLSEGSNTLADGMNKLLDGSQTLKDGMKEFQEEGIQKLVDLYNDDIVGLQDRFDAMKQAGKDYQTYTKLADGQKGSVKFIYKAE
ncbi:MAG: hypothetical protein Q4E53_03540 [Eubacteriales bacterium]|nr:hypothetical protein [Eubacteriales bacterium]